MFKIKFFSEINQSVQKYREDAENTYAHKKPIHFEEVKGHSATINTSSINQPINHAVNQC